MGLVQTAHSIMCAQELTAAIFVVNSVLCQLFIIPVQWWQLTMPSEACTSSSYFLWLAVGVRYIVTGLEKYNSLQTSGIRQSSLTTSVRLHSMCIGWSHSLPEANPPAHSQVAVRGRETPHMHCTSTTAPVVASDHARKVFSSVIFSEAEATIVVSQTQPSAVRKDIG